MTSFFCNPTNLLPLLSLLQTLSPSTAAVIYNDSKNQTIRWVDCHDKVPEPLAAALNITGTTFTGTLPSSLFCGEMDVPMDYTKPFNAVTNNITIGFAMNRPKKSSGLLA